MALTDPPPAEVPDDTRSMLLSPLSRGQAALERRAELRDSLSNRVTRSLRASSEVGVSQMHVSRLIRDSVDRLREPADLDTASAA